MLLAAISFACIVLGTPLWWFWWRPYSAGRAMERGFYGEMV